MNKLPVYLFILSLLILPALAIDANIYEASDFTKHPEQMVILQERDLIKLNWADKEHKLMVRAVYPDKKKVDLTVFIEGSEVPYYTTITPKTSLQLDFDKDDVFDLKVSVFNLLEEAGKKFVALKLERLEKEQSSITTLAIEEKNSTHSFIIQNNIYLFIGVILLSLVLWKRKFVLKIYEELKK